MTKTLQRPKAVLFDLFHTLVCVPPPALVGEISVPEILGVSAPEWQRRYYDEDHLGRCLGGGLASFRLRFGCEHTKPSANRRVHGHSHNHRGEPEQCTKTENDSRPRLHPGTVESG